MYPESGFRGTAITILLMIFTCASIWAQTQDARQVFPSDATSPAQAGGPAFLEILCPGQVVNTSELGCRTGCPKYTDFGIYGDESTWSLRAVTRGHFLSPVSDDAVLSMEGCEPHSENFGGTVLLTQRSGHWAMLWYKAGVETLQCHKIQLRDARDILVCIGRYGGQGNNSTDLYVEDLLTPTGSLMAEDERTQTVFSATDTTFTCGLNDDDVQKPFPVVRSSIDKVEFSSGKARGESLMVVTASFGRKNMTAADAEACMAGRGALPATTAYHLEFVFDGHKYNVSPSSAKASKLFETW